MEWMPLILAIVLAAVHLMARKMVFLESIPRSKFLSIAGGVSVAYVFIHILPELNEHQESIAESVELIAFLEHHAYLLAMLGLVIFYGLEKVVQDSKKENEEVVHRPKKSAFWLHISSFFIYNGLIGYLLVHREETGLLNLMLYGIAMALHFVVVDFGLREHHKERYDREGRWLLAFAIVIGWAIGFLTEIPEALLALLFAFLSGSIILNVLKEELPQERQSSFWAFALGGIAYVILLLSVG
ncbi:hypothetical protein V1502_03555 [Bacillus sp. SCS-153A]|uniref:hypothetical protein n=1 Tax=Rossellomorea sedimentorum TaxID=3115294 RepID=UPI0039069001